jgi:hypothetical protein
VSDTVAQNWYFTFGGGHRLRAARSDGVTVGEGFPVADFYVMIHGTFLDARHEMIRLFGTVWSFQYDAEEWAGQVERYRLVPLLAVPEKIARDGDGDWLVCLCGNDPSQSGFEPCLPDGTPVEPVTGGRWTGNLYVCSDCGRIVDQDTLHVTGRRGEAYIRTLHAKITDLENQVGRLTPDDNPGWSPTG